MCAVRILFCMHFLEQVLIELDTNTDISQKRSHCHRRPQNQFLRLLDFFSKLLTGGSLGMPAIFFQFQYGRLEAPDNLFKPNIKSPPIAYQHIVT